AEAAASKPSSSRPLQTLRRRQTVTVRRCDEEESGPARGKARRKECEAPRRAHQLRAPAKCQVPRTRGRAGLDQATLACSEAAVKRAPKGSGDCGHGGQNAREPKAGSARPLDRVTQGGMG